MNRRHLLAALCALPFIGPVFDRALAQSRRKEILAFYYGWYATPDISGSYQHWLNPDLKARTLEESPDYPASGLYDSLDPKVMQRHADEAKRAGLTGLICSWWGQNDHTDKQLGPFLKVLAAQGLTATAYIERAETVEMLVEDIAYLHKRYADHPAWLKVDGRPVLFLFDRVIQTIGLEGWQKAREAVRSQLGEAFYFAGTANTLEEIEERTPHYDILHIYSIQFEAAEWRLSRSLWRGRFYKNWVEAQKNPPLVRTTATLLPAFDDRELGRGKKRPVVPRDNGETLAKFWLAAIDARPDWVLLVSFNEWHEDSQIEPSDTYGERDMLINAKMARQFMP
ncbi:hypothetical protein [Asticcacaulis tiandongensis]|uniref:hypothetical protein n=1 Tax=Asticcacaulis tiandongensis TaxID=2565365 RepID=UPI00112E3121|nr:hypothetical protein [Asticcacaulis tiandongensis]